MSTLLASRLAAVQPSITLAINAKAAAMRASGVDVISFGVGEPDFEPPSFVLEGAISAIRAGASKYTAVTGTAALKDAIAADCERRRGYRPAASDICVSVGAKHALFNAALALYEHGDEIIVPAPYWVSYPEQVRMMGATPVVIETRMQEHFKLRANTLENAITARTKAVVLCSPSNPTGVAYTHSELRALADVVAKHDLWVIVDEIYAQLVYDGFEQVSLATVAPELRDRIVVIDGVSKSHAMTGWRIGWSIAPAPLARAIDVVQGQSTTNAAAVSQAAACAALNGPGDDLLAMVSVFSSRRRVMVGGLNTLPGVQCIMPEGAFYAFADVTQLVGCTIAGIKIENDDVLAMVLLEQAHVACVPGSAFGAPGYIRFSYAVSEERIQEGIERMAALFAL